MIEPIPLSPRSQRADDYTLMRRVVDGDGRAFEVLYERYEPRLRGYLQAQLGRPDLAEDACQEVLLLVWKTADRFQYTSRLSTWIFGIAWRIANRTRNRARLPQLQPDPVESHLAAALNPAADLEDQERKRALAHGLNTLPQPLRRTVELRYHLNHTSKEIAEQMHCSITQVNYRLRQAQRRLAVALRQQERPLAHAV